MIMFGLPDLQTRQEIIAQYAKQLSKPELVQLAHATEAYSFSLFSFNIIIIKFAMNPVSSTRTFSF